MAKINFKQPKYVIPLICTPFVIASFFIWGGKMKATPVENNVAVDGFNANMPGVDTSIAKGEVKDKFDAYQQAFKTARDQTGMGDIDVDRANLGLQYNSSYSPDDIERIKAQRKMDSLNNSLMETRDKIQSQFGSLQQEDKSKSKQTSRYSRSEEDPVLAQLLKVQQAAADNAKGSSKKRTTSDDDSYKKQMMAFKEQMNYVDSMQRANGLNPVTGEPLSKSGDGKSGKSYAKNFDPTKDKSFKPLPISAAGSKRHSIFNTLHNSNSIDDITAMLDQDVKATLGSRVRIRLLKDMYVGDYLVKKGAYIYGVVTGFQKQRVNISIAQIMYNNQALPVKIDVFDSDGYLGLYVPGSNFREFTKEIGSQATQGMSSAVTPDGSDIKMNLLSQVFNTTTTTIGQLIKKDKAFLKYNYIVYLKENKSASDKN